MKAKLYIVMLLFITVTLLLYSCDNHTISDDSSTSQSIDDISEWNIYAYKKIEGIQILTENGQPYIPFTQLIQAFGYQVSWQSDTIAQVSKDESIYILDLKNKSFHPQNAENDNYFTVSASNVIGLPKMMLVKEQEIFVHTSIASAVIGRLPEGVRGIKIEDNNIFVGTYRDSYDH